MKIGEFIYKHLNDIAKTVPLNVPIETKPPFITYNIDGQEVTKTITATGFIENFVTITVYENEYDKAVDLAQKVKATLECSQEQNIIGVTYTSVSDGFDNEPLNRYWVALEFNIYER